MRLMFWRHRRVPEAIYQLLPVIYRLAGGWVFSVGQGVLAATSGLLLWLASALVFLWRRDARLLQLKKQRKFRQDPFPLPPPRERLRRFGSTASLFRINPTVSCR